MLVEDDIYFAESIEKAIRRIDGCEVTWKKSMNGALAALDSEPFDLVILDRRIPTEDDSLNEHVDHGGAVFESIVNNQPGTPVWFLTGNIDPQFPNEIHDAHGRRGDIHCRGRDDPVYRVFWKDRLPSCIVAVREFRAEIQRTELVHPVQVGIPVNLRPEETHLLRLFGRKHGGARIEAQALTDGLSDARVLRVSVFDAADALVITSVAKLGRFEEIDAEQAKYRSEIVKLTAGSFPPVTAEINLGAASYRGIFYGVVGDKLRNLFDELAANPSHSASVANELRSDQATWHRAGQVESVKIANIRRSLISDVEMQKITEELAGIDLRKVEEVVVSVNRCVQHGDFHCANVLFDGRGRPMSIDYSCTGRSFASIDPLTLELCTIFHKNAPDRGGWPSEHQAARWPEIELFCASAPHEEYLRACRTWALEVAGSEQEIWAVAYGYALRQLKYNDTDKTIARAIVSSCIERLLGWAGSSVENGR